MHSLIVVLFGQIDYCQGLVGRYRPTKKGQKAAAHQLCWTSERAKYAHAQKSQLQIYSISAHTCHSDCKVSQDLVGMPWLATVQPRIIIWHIDYLQQFLSNMSSVGRCNPNTIFKPENWHRRALGVTGKFNGISTSKHQLFQKGGLTSQVFCKGKKRGKWVNKSTYQRMKEYF